MVRNIAYRLALLENNWRINSSMIKKDTDLIILTEPEEPCFIVMIILITSKYNFFFKVLECLNLDFLEVKLGYHLLEKCNKTR